MAPELIGVMRHISVPNARTDRGYEGGGQDHQPELIGVMRAFHVSLARTDRGYEVKGLFMRQN